MTDRDDLIEAGALALPSLVRPYVYLAESVIDAVEPLIRADERERIANDSLRWVAARTAERIAQDHERKAEESGDPVWLNAAADARRIGGVQ